MILKRIALTPRHLSGLPSFPASDKEDDPRYEWRMAEYPKGKMFVVYCAGPHCNGANKAALCLARLGLPVKMMIGGVTGWIDEGYYTGSHTAYRSREASEDVARVLGQTL